MKYRNPILSGMNPDPSVCRVGSDFYLVTSSFEYFPAIPIYHSTDLIHWEQLGHVLDRSSQVRLAAGAPNCLGIYAPTIRYHEGVYYCIVTNVGGRRGGNFFVYTTNPRGRWSDPVRLPYGGIDPSLFFDEDGHCYYTGTDNGIFIAELSFHMENGVLCDLSCGEKHAVWNGTGANNPEGPHLYRIDGMYYLMLAEGGTEYCHMVSIARSHEVYGPYESCPHNPVLSNRCTGLPIKCCGHADLVEDANGHWWAVCLGTRPLSYPFRHNLGRETMLVPVRWENGWPVMGEDGHVPERVEVAQSAGKKTRKSDLYVPGSDVCDHFTEKKLHPSWNTVYNFSKKHIILAGSELLLRAYDTTLTLDVPKALLVRRQEHHNFTASVTLTLDSVSAGAEAGITIYMNNRHHYEAALATTGSGQYFLILRRQIGSLQAVEQQIPYHGNRVQLFLSGTKENYTFSYQACDCGCPPVTSTVYPSAAEAPVVIGSGETQYLTTEVGGCFTGNFIGIYASRADALVTEFTYHKN